MKRLSLVSAALSTVLAISGCASTAVNEEAEQRPINSELISSWLDSCGENSSSKECANYATDLALYEELIGYDTSGGRFLMADPYIPGDSNDLTKPGFVGCASSFTGDICFVNLRIFNRGNKPFQGNLYAQMIGKQGTIEATEPLYLSSPLNPNAGGVHEFNFETGPDFSGFTYFQLISGDSVVGEIRLCEYPYNGNIYYYNCLRLEQFTYENGDFNLSPSK